MLTFPGVVLHEAAHWMACERAGVQVYDVKLFELFGNPPGYVRYEAADTSTTAALITFAPLVVNTIATIIMGVLIGLFLLLDVNAAAIIPAWLGISFGLHAFPSNVDASVLREASGVFGIIVEGFIKLANYSRFVWFDFIYTFIWISIGISLV